MNSAEFVDYFNKRFPQLPEKLTRDRLRKWDEWGVLRPHPEYYRDDIHTAHGLLRMMDDLGQEHGGPRFTPAPASEGIVRQVVSILSDDDKERGMIRLAMLHSGLMSAPGFVVINFSPFTGITIESLDPQALQKSAANHLVVTREVIELENEATGEILTLLAPVLFWRG